MASIEESPVMAMDANSKAVRSNFPQDAFAFCHLKQVLAFLGIGRSRFYVLMAEGKMPRPAINAGRHRTWQVGAIRAAAEKLGRGDL